MSGRLARKASQRAPQDGAAAAQTSTAAPRGGVALGRLVAREGEGWRVAVGRGTVLAARDPSVDDALLADCAARGARVVLDLDGPAAIVGALATARPLTVDAQGDVRAKVRVFEVAAEEEATLRTDRAFVQVRGADVETFGRNVITRARELAKLLGRMVKIN
jgi:hypothetical protein